MTLKVIFLGNHTVGINVLNILLTHKNVDLVGIVAHPKDSEDGIIYESVYDFAIKNKIKSIRSNLTHKNDVNFIKLLEPDLLFVTDFKFIIKKNILDIPRIGSINLHPSLLPKYRGRASINWAIINNENFTGVTTFFIDDKIDTGDVLLQEKIKVDKKINAGELHDKLKVIGAITVKKTIKEILNNTLIKKKQKQDGNYKTAYKLDKENLNHLLNQALCIHLIQKSNLFPP